MKTKTKIKAGLVALGIDGEAKDNAHAKWVEGP